MGTQYTLPAPSPQKKTKKQRKSLKSLKVLLPKDRFLTLHEFLTNNVSPDMQSLPIIK